MGVSLARSQGLRMDKASNSAQSFKAGCFGGRCLAPAPPW